MKKFILPTLLIIFSTVLFSACKKSTNQAVQTEAPAPAIEEQQQQQQDGGDFSGTIKDLISSGKAQKCTWTLPEQGSSTVYVDGQKTRIEINMPITEDQPARQMITVSDPTWAYTWNPGVKEGMKMNIEEMAKEAQEALNADEQTPTDGNDDDYQAMVNQDYQFKCDSWKADSSMFIPPTDVEFVDMNATMVKVQQDAKNMKKMCEMLSGEQKEECLRGFEE